MWMELERIDCSKDKGVSTLPFFCCLISWFIKKVFREEDEKRSFSMVAIRDRKRSGEERYRKRISSGLLRKRPINCSPAIERMDISSCALR